MLVEVKDFKGYFVDEIGNVYGKNGNPLKPSDNGNGYKIVILRKDNKSYAKTVHRLIANAFLENPNGFAEINHKDENKSNNKVENLEWCNHSYNNSYGTKIDRMKNTWEKNKINCKKVVCIETGIKYASIKDAATALNIFSGDISRACRNVKNHNKCGGYHWEYADVE